MFPSRPTLFSRFGGAAGVALVCSMVVGGAVPHAVAQTRALPGAKPAASAPSAAPSAAPTSKPASAPKGAGSAAASATAAPAAAPPEAIEGSDELQRLYMQGDEALKRLAYVEAEVALTRAWGLSKSFDVAGKLGETKLEMGKYREAAELLSFALRNALPSTRPKRRERLRNALDKVKEKLATVKLTASVVEARLSIDGAAIDPLFLGPELFVDPGKRSFEASAAGYTTAKQAVETKAGEIYVVTLALEAVSKEPVVVAPVEQSTPWPAAALGAAGGAALIGGAVLVGVAESRKAEAYALARNTLTADGNPTCPKKGPGPTEQCDKVRAAAADVDMFGNAGIGVLIGGGVLMAAAAAYVLWPRAAPAKTTPAKAAAKAGVVVPVVGPNGGGLVWRGSF